MYEEILRQVGLSQNESRIYESLITMGKTTVEKISNRSGVHRRNTYDTLNKLIEKGLVSEVFVGGNKHYSATNPRRLQELLQEKESNLNNIIPELQKKYAKVEESSEAYLYKGIEGFKNYLNDILEANETVYFIGAKAFWLDPRLRIHIAKFEQKRKKQGIKFMHLFDYEIKKQKPEILGLVGKPYKFLPKEYSSNTAIDVFGDYVVTFVGAQPGYLEEVPVQFVMKNKSLANGYRKFFQFMWDKSP
ncbi:MAG: helix-turn-helix domain-containing protein [Candidatus ainarchaeum sp.]|nr:helix-turn-helix domain-containing protein [Candidatus ainarchaeum sp.]